MKTTVNTELDLQMKIKIINYNNWETLDIKQKDPPPKVVNIIINQIVKKCRSLQCTIANTKQKHNGQLKMFSIYLRL